MNARVVVPPHTHTYEEEPHHHPHPHHQGLGDLHSSGGHDQDNEHHDKKSVIKKVKAKAKKIKDTLGSKLHGHDEHDRVYDLDEDDDFDDEEIEQDPEVHGAPMYESTAVMMGKDEILNSGKKQFNLEGKSNPGQTQIRLGQSTALDVDPNAPKDRTERSSPGNYQTKVADPTGAGGKEADVEPIIRSFGKMEFTEPEHKSTGITGTGSHDQFSPDSTTTTQLGTNKTGSPENTPAVLPRQTFGTSESQQSHPEPEHMNVVTEEPNRNPSSYTEKITSIAGSATSAITDTAKSAKNVVTSKLGYGGNNDHSATETKKQDSAMGESAMAMGDYGKQIASTVTEKLAPVYEKVTGAGTAMVSKIQGTSTGSGGDDVGKVGVGKEQDKGVSIKDYLAQKLIPGDEDKALSEVISGVIHKRKEEFPEKVAENMDKVSESPKVARRLGTGEHEKNEGSYGGDYNQVSIGSSNGNNKGMVGMVKGMVSSWFGKGNGDQINADDQQRVSRGGNGEREDASNEMSTGKEASHETSKEGLVH